MLQLRCCLWMCIACLKTCYTTWNVCVITHQIKVVPTDNHVLVSCTQVICTSLYQYLIEEHILDLLAFQPGYSLKCILQIYYVIHHELENVCDYSLEQIDFGLFNGNLLQHGCFAMEMLV